MNLYFSSCCHSSTRTFIILNFHPTLRKSSLTFKNTDTRQSIITKHLLLHFQNFFWKLYKEFQVNVLLDIIVNHNATEISGRQQDYCVTYIWIIILYNLTGPSKVVTNCLNWDHFWIEFQEHSFEFQPASTYWWNND